MKLPRRQFLHLAAGAAALPAVSRIARAQTYPTRPITMTVPFAAGGPADTVGRIVAQQMRATLGQTIVVENVAGATGRLGVERALRAQAASRFGKSLKRNGYRVSLASITNRRPFSILRRTRN